MYAFYLFGHEIPFKNKSLIVVFSTAGYTLIKVKHTS
jgi:hypothetical protein